MNNKLLGLNRNKREDFTNFPKLKVDDENDDSGITASTRRSYKLTAPKRKFKGNAQSFRNKFIDSSISTKLQSEDTTKNNENYILSYFPTENVNKIATSETSTLKTTNVNDLELTTLFKSTDTTIPVIETPSQLNFDDILEISTSSIDEDFDKTTSENHYITSTSKLTSELQQHVNNKSLTTASVELHSDMEETEISTEQITTLSSSTIDNGITEKSDEFGALETISFDQDLDEPAKTSGFKLTSISSTTPSSGQIIPKITSRKSNNFYNNKNNENDDMPYSPTDNVRSEASKVVTNSYNSEFSTQSSSTTVPDVELLQTHLKPFTVTFSVTSAEKLSEDAKSKTNSYGEITNLITQSPADNVGATAISVTENNLETSPDSTSQILGHKSSSKLSSVMYELPEEVIDENMASLHPGLKSTISTHMEYNKELTTTLTHIEENAETLSEDDKSKSNNYEEHKNVVTQHPINDVGVTTVSVAENKLESSPDLTSKMLDEQSNSKFSSVMDELPKETPSKITINENMVSLNPALKTTGIHMDDNKELKTTLAHTEGNGETLTEDVKSKTTNYGENNNVVTQHPINAVPVSTTSVTGNKLETFPATSTILSNESSSKVFSVINELPKETPSKVPTDENMASLNPELKTIAIHMQDNKEITTTITHIEGNAETLSEDVKSKTSNYGKNSNIVTQHPVHDVEITTTSVTENKLETWPASTSIILDGEGSSKISSVLNELPKETPTKVPTDENMASLNLGLETTAIHMEDNKELTTTLTHIQGNAETLSEEVKSETNHYGENKNVVTILTINDIGVITTSVTENKLETGPELTSQIVHDESSSKLSSLIEEISKETPSKGIIDENMVSLNPVLKTTETYMEDNKELTTTLTHTGGNVETLPEEVLSKTNNYGENTNVVTEHPINAVEVTTTSVTKNKLDNWPELTSKHLDNESSSKLSSIIDDVPKETSTKSAIENMASLNPELKTTETHVEDNKEVTTTLTHTGGNVETLPEEVLFKTNNYGENTNVVTEHPINAVEVTTTSVTKNKLDNWPELTSKHLDNESSSKLSSIIDDVPKETSTKSAIENMASLNPELKTTETHVEDNKEVTTTLTHTGGNVETLPEEVLFKTNNYGENTNVVTEHPINDVGVTSTSVTENTLETWPELTSTILDNESSSKLSTIIDNLPKETSLTTTLAHTGVETLPEEVISKTNNYGENTNVLTERPINDVGVTTTSVTEKKLETWPDSTSKGLDYESSSKLSSVIEEHQKETPSKVDENMASLNIELKTTATHMENNKELTTTPTHTGGNADTLSEGVKFKSNNDGENKNVVTQHPISNVAVTTTSVTENKLETSPDLTSEILSDKSTSQISSTIDKLTKEIQSKVTFDENMVSINPALKTTKIHLAELTPAVTHTEENKDILTTSEFLTTSKSTPLADVFQSELTTENGVMLTFSKEHENGPTRIIGETSKVNNKAEILPHILKSTHNIFEEFKIKETTNEDMGRTEPMVATEVKILSQILETTHNPFMENQLKIITDEDMILQGADRLTTETEDMVTLATLSKEHENVPTKIVDNISSYVTNKVDILPQISKSTPNIFEELKLNETTNKDIVHTEIKNLSPTLKTTRNLFIENEQKLITDEDMILQGPEKLTTQNEDMVTVATLSKGEVPTKVENLLHSSKNTYKILQETANEDMGPTEPLLITELEILPQTKTQIENELKLTTNEGFITEEEEKLTTKNGAMVTFATLSEEPKNVPTGALGETSSKITSKVEVLPPSLKSTHNILKEFNLKETVNEDMAPTEHVLITEVEVLPPNLQTTYNPFVENESKLTTDENMILQGKLTTENGAMVTFATLSKEHGNVPTKIIGETISQVTTTIKALAHSSKNTDNIIKETVNKDMGSTEPVLTTKVEILPQILKTTHNPFVENELKLENIILQEGKLTTENGATVVFATLSEEPKNVPTGALGETSSKITSTVEVLPPSLKSTHNILKEFNLKETVNEDMAPTEPVLITEVEVLPPNLQTTYNPFVENESKLTTDENMILQGKLTTENGAMVTFATLSKEHGNMPTKVIGETISQFTTTEEALAHSSKNTDNILKETVNKNMSPTEPVLITKVEILPQILKTTHNLFVENELKLTTEENMILQEDKLTTANGATVTLSTLSKEHENVQTKIVGETSSQVVTTVEVLPQSLKNTDTILKETVNEDMAPTEPVLTTELEILPQILKTTYNPFIENESKLTTNEDMVLQETEKATVTNFEEHKELLTSSEHKTHIITATETLPNIATVKLPQESVVLTTKAEKIKSKLWPDLTTTVAIAPHILTKTTKNYFNEFLLEDTTANEDMAPIEHHSTLTTLPQILKTTLDLFMVNQLSSETTDEDMLSKEVELTTTIEGNSELPTSNAIVTSQKVNMTEAKGTTNTGAKLPKEPELSSTINQVEENKKLSTILNELLTLTEKTYGSESSETATLTQETQLKETTNIDQFSDVTELTENTNFLTQIKSESIETTMETLPHISKTTHNIFKSFQAKGTTDEDMALIESNVSTVVSIVPPISKITPNPFLENELKKTSSNEDMGLIGIGVTTSADENDNTYIKGKPETMSKLSSALTNIENVPHEIVTQHESTTKSANVLHHEILDLTTGNKITLNTHTIGFETPAKSLPHLSTTTNYNQIKETQLGSATTNQLISSESTVSFITPEPNHLKTTQNVDFSTTHSDNNVGSSDKTNVYLTSHESPSGVTGLTSNMENTMESSSLRKEQSTTPNYKGVTGSSLLSSNNLLKENNQTFSSSEELTSKISGDKDGDLVTWPENTATTDVNTESTLLTKFTSPGLVNTENPNSNNVTEIFQNEIAFSSTPKEISNETSPTLPDELKDLNQTSVEQSTHLPQITTAESSNESTAIPTTVNSNGVPVGSSNSPNTMKSSSLNKEQPIYSKVTTESLKENNQTFGNFQQSTSKISGDENGDWVTWPESNATTDINTESTLLTKFTSSGSVNTESPNSNNMTEIFQDIIAFSSTTNEISNETSPTLPYELKDLNQATVEQSTHLPQITTAESSNESTAIPTTVNSNGVPVGTSNSPNTMKSSSLNKEQPISSKVTTESLKENNQTFGNFQQLTSKISGDENGDWVTWPESNATTDLNTESTLLTKFTSSGSVNTESSNLNNVTEIFQDEVAFSSTPKEISNETSPTLPDELKDLNQTSVEQSTHLPQITTVESSNESTAIPTTVNSNGVPVGTSNSPNTMKSSSLNKEQPISSKVTTESLKENNQTFGNFQQLTSKISGNENGDWVTWPESNATTDINTESTLLTKFTSSGSVNTESPNSNNATEIFQNVIAFSSTMNESSRETSATLPDELKADFNQTTVEQSTNLSQITTVQNSFESTMISPKVNSVITTEGYQLKDITTNLLTSYLSTTGTVDTLHALQTKDHFNGSDNSLDKPEFRKTTPGNITSEISSGQVTTQLMNETSTKSIGTDLVSNTKLDIGISLKPTTLAEHHLTLPFEIESDVDLTSEKEELSNATTLNPDHTLTHKPTLLALLESNDKENIITSVNGTATTEGFNKTISLNQSELQNLTTVSENEKQNTTLSDLASTLEITTGFISMSNQNYSNSNTMPNSTEVDHSKVSTSSNGYITSNHTQTDVHPDHDSHDQVIKSQIVNDGVTPIPVNQNDVHDKIQQSNSNVWHNQSATDQRALLTSSKEFIVSDQIETTKLSIATENHEIKSTHSDFSQISTSDTFSISGSQNYHTEPHGTNLTHNPSEVTVISNEVPQSNPVSIATTVTDQNYQTEQYDTNLMHNPAETTKPYTSILSKSTENVEILSHGQTLRTEPGNKLTSMIFNETIQSNPTSLSGTDNTLKFISESGKTDLNLDSFATGAFLTTLSMLSIPSTITENIYNTVSHAKILEHSENTNNPISTVSPHLELLDEQFIHFRTTSKKVNATSEYTTTNVFEGSTHKSYLPNSTTSSSGEFLVSSTENTVLNTEGILEKQSENIQNSHTTLGPQQGISTNELTHAINSEHEQLSTVSVNPQLSERIDTSFTTPTNFITHSIGTEVIANTENKSTQSTEDLAKHSENIQSSHTTLGPEQGVSGNDLTHSMYTENQPLSTVSINPELLESIHTSFISSTNIITHNTGNEVTLNPENNIPQSTEDLTKHSENIQSNHTTYGPDQGISGNELTHSINTEYQPLSTVSISPELLESTHTSFTSHTNIITNNPANEVTLNPENNISQSTEDLARHSENIQISHTTLGSEQGVSGNDLAHSINTEHEPLSTKNINPELSESIHTSFTTPTNFITHSMGTEVISNTENKSTQSTEDLAKHSENIQSSHTTLGPEQGVSGNDLTHSMYTENQPLSTVSINPELLESIHTSFISSTNIITHNTGNEVTLNPENNIPQSTEDLTKHSENIQSDHTTYGPDQGISGNELTHSINTEYQPLSTVSISPELLESTHTSFTSHTNIITNNPANEVTLNPENNISQSTEDLSKHSENIQSSHTTLGPEQGISGSELTHSINTENQPVSTMNINPELLSPTTAIVHTNEHETALPNTDNKFLTSTEYTIYEDLTKHSEYNQTSHPEISPKLEILDEELIQLPIKGKLSTKIETHSSADTTFTTSLKISQNHNITLLASLGTLDNELLHTSTTPSLSSVYTDSDKMHTNFSNSIPIIISTTSSEISQHMHTTPVANLEISGNELSHLPNTATQSMSNANTEQQITDNTHSTSTNPTPIVISSTTLSEISQNMHTTPIANLEISSDKESSHLPNTATPNANTEQQIPDNMHSTSTYPTPIVISSTTLSEISLNMHTTPIANLEISDKESSHLPNTEIPNANTEQQNPDNMHSTFTNPTPIVISSTNLSEISQNMHTTPVANLEIADKESSHLPNTATQSLSNANIEQQILDNIYSSFSNPSTIVTHGTGHELISNTEKILINYTENVINNQNGPTTLASNLTVSGNELLNTENQPLSNVNINEHTLESTHTNFINPTTFIINGTKSEHILTNTEFLKSTEFTMFEDITKHLETTIDHTTVVPKLEILDEELLQLPSKLSNELKTQTHHTDFTTLSEINENIHTTSVSNLEISGNELSPFPNSATHSSSSVNAEQQVPSDNMHTSLSNHTPTIIHSTSLKDLSQNLHSTTLTHLEISDHKLSHFPNTATQPWTSVNSEQRISDNMHTNFTGSIPSIIHQTSLSDSSQNLGNHSSSTNPLTLIIHSTKSESKLSNADNESFSSTEFMVYTDLTKHLETSQINHTTNAPKLEILDEEFIEISNKTRFSTESTTHTDLISLSELISLPTITLFEQIFTNFTNDYDSTNLSTTSNLFENHTTSFNIKQDKEEEKSTLSEINNQQINVVTSEHSLGSESSGTGSVVMQNTNSITNTSNHEETISTFSDFSSSTESYKDVMNKKLNSFHEWLGSPSINDTNQTTMFSNVNESTLVTKTDSNIVSLSTIESQVDKVTIEHEHLSTHTHSTVSHFQNITNEDRFHTSQQDSKIKTNGATINTISGAEEHQSNPNQEHASRHGLDQNHTLAPVTTISPLDHSQNYHSEGLKVNQEHSSSKSHSGSSQHLEDQHLKSTFGNNLNKSTISDEIPTSSKEHHSPPEPTSSSPFTNSNFNIPNITTESLAFHNKSSITESYNSENFLETDKAINHKNDSGVSEIPTTQKIKNLNHVTSTQHESESIENLTKIQNETSGDALYIKNKIDTQASETSNLTITSLKNTTKEFEEIPDEQEWHWSEMKSNHSTLSSNLDGHSTGLHVTHQANHNGLDNSLTGDHAKITQADIPLASPKFEPADNDILFSSKPNLSTIALEHLSKSPNLVTHVTHPAISKPESIKNIPPLEIQTNQHNPIEGNENVHQTKGKCPNAPIYINLPVYPVDSTFPLLLKFNQYYSSTTTSSIIIDDEATDRVLNTEQFRTMKLEDFNAVTEFPVTSIFTEGSAISKLSNTDQAFSDDMHLSTTINQALKTDHIEQNEQTVGLTTKSEVTHGEKSQEKLNQVLNEYIQQNQQNAELTTKSHTVLIGTTEEKVNQNISSGVTELLTLGSSLGVTHIENTLVTSSNTLSEVIISSEEINKGSESAVLNVTEHSQPVMIISEFPKFQEESTCNYTDYLSQNNCMCSMDNLIKDLRMKLVNNFLNFSIDNFTCPIFTHVEAGIYLGNDSIPHVAKARRDVSDMFSIIVRRETIEYQNMDKTLNEQLELKNTENDIFATPGMKILIPCISTNNLSEGSANYSWTFSDNLPLTEGKIQETEGTLTIDNVAPQDAGNYTCIETSNNANKSSEKRYEHHLSVVSIPSYRLQTTLLYNSTEKCQSGDADIISLYLPNSLEGLICGNYFKVCSIEVKNPKCLNATQYTSVNLSVIIEPINVIMPTINNSVCDVGCEMKIYTHVVLFIIKNLEQVLKLPVFFRLSYRQQKLIPTEVVIKKTKQKLGTEAPKLIITCPPGFGYYKRTHVCGTCGRNTFSRGDETFCSPCPAGQYQPMVGSKSCLVCATPLQDPYCLRVMYSNTHKFRVLIGITTTILVVLVILLLCLKSMKKSTNSKSNTKFGRESYLKSKRQSKRRSRDLDLEMQDSQPLLDSSRDRKYKGYNKKPPEPPPPDFN